MAEVNKPATSPTPAAPPSSSMSPPPAPAPAPQLTREQKLAALCEQEFLRIQELVQPANFSHRGYCTKCGWQSYQHSAAGVREVVGRHVMVHWRDVVGML